MEIRLFSDIHLEFNDYTIPHLQGDEDRILVLAGDIGVGQPVVEFLLRHQHQFRHIFYVLGNHEFYGGYIDDVRAFWSSHTDSADTIPNLTVLDCDKTQEIDGVVFYGGTMWTDYNNSHPIDMMIAEGAMTDFTRILGEETPSDIVLFHNEFKQYLDTHLPFQDMSKKHVVISHHLPSVQCVAPCYQGDSLNTAFHANMDRDGYFDAYKIDHWFCGHSHIACNVMVNETKVRSNPRGYSDWEPESSTGFDPELILVV